MDVYGTAVTVITQIYQVTVFIKGVVSDIKSFDADREDIQSKLDVQLVSLVIFKRSFSGRKDGSMPAWGSDPFIAGAVERLLMQMKRTLGEYEGVAAKYGMMDDENTVNIDAPKEQESLFERAKSKAKTLKLKGLNWSLFDKKKLYEIIEAYTRRSEDLRNIMQHFSQETIFSLVDGDPQGLKSVGLEPVMEMRKLADSKAPAEFQSLSGNIIEEGKPVERFQLAKWSPSGSEESTVLVEYHEYERELKLEDLSLDEVTELKEPIRGLAWLLKSATFSSDSSKSLKQPEIYALQCIGFVDQPSEERTAFLYDIPSSQKEGATPMTLHSFINQIDGTNKRPMKRPSLNDRFSMAHSLALTLSNVHAAGWVHKNIWSRGILLFSEQASGVSTSGLTEQRLSPNAEAKIISYLGDWGYARSVEQGTDMNADFEVEPNFYRHPNRQGRPTRQFTRFHDIYALGVVLLEIGLWVTLSRLMERRIKEAESSGALPRPKKVADELLALASQGLPKEMGLRYTQAVISCLKGDFKGSEGPSLAIDFQEKVLNVLSSGMEL